MKVQRALSGMLLGLGCCAAFLGLIGVVLPRMENEQLKLVLASFEVPSRFALVNAANAGMLLLMKHGWMVLCAGGIGALAGGIWFACVTDTEMPAPPQRVIRKAAGPVAVAVEAQINPFAVGCQQCEETRPDFAPQAQNAPASFITAHKPLLEENRIEEMPERMPIAFASESLAITTELEEESPSGARAILRTPQTIEMSEEALPAAVQPEPLPLTEKAPAQSLQPSPRIRSTMGQHRQW